MGVLVAVYSGVEMNDDRRARDEAEFLAQLAERRTATADKRARAAEAQNTALVAAMHAMREVLDEVQEAADMARDPRLRRGNQGKSAGVVPSSAI